MHQKRRKMLFSARQQRAIAIAGVSNVFITGPGGCGKSAVLDEICKKLEAEGAIYRITASTGIAACNIGGTTVHRMVGMGLAKEPIEDLVRKTKKNSRLRNMWREMQVLIIDEISMLGIDFFCAMDEIAQHMRNSLQPFGGIKLVLSGDFLQLQTIGANSLGCEFLFQTQLWEELDLEVILLDEIFRQENVEFAQLLCRMRTAQLTEEDVYFINSLDRSVESEDPLCIYAVNSLVDDLNACRLKSVEGIEREYVADVECSELQGAPKLSASAKEAYCKHAVETNRVGERLTLKVGTKVMLVANVSVDEGLCNGARGEVTDFEPLTYKPMVRFENGLVCEIDPFKWETKIPGECKVIFRQMPLIIAYACSVHKVQGLSLRSMKVDLGNTIFCPGQSYVALSRATDPELTCVRNFDPSKVTASKSAVDYYKSLESSVAR
jgi:ATP-dependent DNA helicase PIF1